MFQIQTTNLPHEQQKRLHSDFLANEEAYMQLREGLLSQYRGQWVAVNGGKVIETGTSLMEIMDRTSNYEGHPYIALVGAENAVVFRARREVFAYDLAYQPFPLPRLCATFWNHAQTHSRRYSDAIPDTGADVSLLPDGDCAEIELFHSPYMAAIAGGVVGSNITTLLYRGKVEIDNRRYAALIQPIPAGRERIIGRDVLNQQRLLFDGPSAQVVVDP